MEIKKNHQEFDALKRSFETAYLNGEDYTSLLYELAKAIVLSCVNKCVQVGAIHQTEYFILKTQIEHDYFASVSDTVNVENNPFFDGIDLIQEAVCLLLEHALAHGPEVGWIDKPYSAFIIANRVRIKEMDTAGYQKITTTPLEECYKTIRRAIDKLQYHSDRDLLSIDSLTPSQLDGLYKNRTGDTEPYQREDVKKWDSEDLMKALKLTVRQERILSLRMQGYGYRAIATYLGVSKSTVTRTLDRLKDKCKALGLP